MSAPFRVRYWHPLRRKLLHQPCADLRRAEIELLGRLRLPYHIRPVVVREDGAEWNGLKDAQGRAIWRREGELWQEEAA